MEEKSAVSIVGREQVLSATGEHGRERSLLIVLDVSILKDFTAKVLWGLGSDKF